MNSESVKAAPHVAALFSPGAIAYQTRDGVAAESLLAEELPFVARAVPKRVREFAAGRTCARAALAQLGFTAVPIPVGAARAPVWPAGITGSISHTDGFCAAVVAATADIRALGLDVELVDSVKSHLWRRIFNADEVGFLHATAPEDVNATATLLFSAKESFYKCQHFLTGQFLGFSDVSVSIEARGFTVRPTRMLDLSQFSAAPWHGRYLRDEDVVTTGMCIV